MNAVKIYESLDNKIIDAACFNPRTVDISEIAMEIRLRIRCIVLFLHSSPHSLPSPPSLLYLRTNLGTICVVQNKNEEALELFEMLVETPIKGRFEHTIVANALTLMGVCLRRLERVIDAILVLQRAISMWMEKKDDVRSVHAWTVLARTYVWTADQASRDAAVLAGRKALEILLGAFRPKSCRYLHRLAHVCLCLAELLNRGENSVHAARRLVDMALAIFRRVEKMCGMQVVAKVQALEQSARISMRCSDQVRALQEVQMALDVFKKCGWMYTEAEVKKMIELRDVILCTPDRLGDLFERGYEVGVLKGLFEFGKLNAVVATIEKW